MSHTRVWVAETQGGWHRETYRVELLLRVIDTNDKCLTNKPRRGHDMDERDCR